jgi:hypothetical protein
VGKNCILSYCRQLEINQVVEDFLLVSELAASYKGVHFGNTFDSFFADASEMNECLFGGRNQLGFAFLQPSLIVGFLEEPVGKLGTVSGAG